MVDPPGAATPLDARTDRDLRRVAQWLGEEGIGSGALHDVRPLVGGTQNVLVSFVAGGQRYVFRRGPVHLRPNSNKAIRREMRVLAALAGTDVPHPRLVAACEDEAVLDDGAVFFLMAHVDGFNATVELPRPHSDAPSLRREMGFAAVDAIAALGAIDPAAVGLADLGRPAGFLERQVPRWLAELDSYARQHPRYRSPSDTGIDDIASWLGTNTPAEFRPGISHGDYHLANVMYARTGPQVAAVVDWEMCTVGDPLVDLGWLLATWPGFGSAGGPLGAAGGLPNRSELVDRYALGSSRDLSRVGWYVVLAGFKLGILLEGTFARSTSGEVPASVGRELRGRAARLFTQARELAAAPAGLRSGE
jgi:aminoglycoside phosphotransferase (APT) family kinase protein